MKAYFLFSMSMFAFAACPGAAADAPTASGSSPGDTRSLAAQVQALQQRVTELRTEYQGKIDALTAQMQRQQAALDALAEGVSARRWPAPTAESSPESAVGPSAFPTTDESVVASSATESPPPAGAASSVSRAPLFPTNDATLVGPSSESTGVVAPAMPAGGGGASGSYMNVSFDAVATLAASTTGDLAGLEVGDHDPQQRGFNLRNQELALSGAVDPYFEGFANIVFKLDNFNETETEVEEAFLQTTSLPAGLQARVGQYFAPFGRINPTHPHTWDFADAPLVIGRFLGPDGLRGAGAQLAWLAPWPWYSQFVVTLQEGRGGTAYSFRNLGDDGTFFTRPTIDRDMHAWSDFVWTGRWENSFDLSPTQTVVLGASLARGPNDTGAASSTRLYGLDLFYKWKPRDAFGGWPFFKWQTEMLWRSYEAGRGAGDLFPVAETFHDRGLYSQFVWGFTDRWTTGLRLDWLDHTNSIFTDDPTRQDRTRVSADLTWYPTEFSKLRLQYNHDSLRANSFQPADAEDSVFLQTEFVLGAHGAHQF